MVLDGTIPSAVSNSGATSTEGQAQDFKATKILSDVTFGTPTGQMHEPLTWKKWNTNSATLHETST